MFLIRRLLLYIVPLLTLGGFLWMRTNTHQWWLVFLITTLSLSVTIWEFTKRKLNKRFFDFLLAPLLLVISNGYFLMFLSDLMLYRATVIVTAVLLYLFLEQILNYFFYSLKYQPYTLESFSFYTNILTVFFVSAGLFSAITFLHTSRFMITGVLLLFALACVYQTFWVHKISWGKSHLFLAAIPLALSQLFLTISFWPTNFFVNALVIAVLFYLMVGLSRLFLLETLNRNSIIFYLTTGFVTVGIVLFTAQWI